METKREELYDLAQRKVRKITKFYKHLLIYAIGLTVYILKRYFGLPLNFPPISYINSFVMWIWTFALAVQGIRIFMTEVVFGQKWENRKIEKMLVRKNEKQNWK